MEKRYVKLDWSKCGWRFGRPGTRNQGFQEAENLTFMLGELHTGHPVNIHSHSYEQVMFIAGGEADLILEDGEVLPVHDGMMIAIPGDLKHALSSKGTETVVNYDFFFPKRPDRTQSELLPGYREQA